MNKKFFYSKILLNLLSYLTLEANFDKNTLISLLPEHPIILEAGAHDGKDTLQFAKIWPQGKIYAFEPVPKLYNLLLEKTKDYSNIYCSSLALSSKTEKAILHISKGRNEASSSLLEPKDLLHYYPDITFENKIEVDTINLNEWAIANRIDRIDLMWLDIQGAEFEVLQAAASILRHTKMIYIKVAYHELYQGSHLFPEVRAWLESEGFFIIHEEKYAFEGNVLLANRYYQTNQSKDNRFVIIIPSYNNEKWCEKNLISVFNQTYENFRIIYIDDASTDKNLEVVEAFLNQFDEHKKTILINNSERLFACANFYKAIHMCDPDEIVVMLDGDDWFAHNNVLAHLNSAYQDSNIWITYGQFREYPGNNIGGARQLPRSVIDNGSYRDYDWVTSALRTFYAGLFHKIKREDLLYDGEHFYPMAWDLAIMYPILEMAGEHSKFISEIIYIYNRATPINDNKVNMGFQVHLSDQIRSKTRYNKITDFH